VLVSYKLFQMTINDQTGGVSCCFVMEIKASQVELKHRKSND